MTPVLPWWQVLLFREHGSAAERNAELPRQFFAINWRDPAMIPTMRDWQRFLDEVSWFLASGESASVGDSLPGREALLRACHS